MAIYFYKINDEYGCFSNFAHYGFELDGKSWMTSEHYFQAQKFAGTKYEGTIRLLANPMKAAEIIIEKTTNDYYWGCGKNGSGKNMLGTA